MLKQRQNISSDGKAALQGFGRVATDPPPAFDPDTAIEAANDFFAANGFVVLSGCLGQSEIHHLNEFYDRTQKVRPEAWGLKKDRKPHHQQQGLIFSQPLLDYPELDSYTQHPSSFPVVARIFGGRERVRFSEFNFREAPENAGIGTMNFHHDAVSADRFTRSPYMPCDWLCAIHYLTDVEPDTPAFCVVPGSNIYNTLQAAFEGLEDAYFEVPIYAPAGTCVLYDTAIFHTRLDGDGIRARRTWHQYYARGGWLPTDTRYIRPPTPVLTNWNLFPERLALHPDPKTRLFFSHWNTAQCEWVASDFDDQIRESMPRGKQ
ncbi:MAG: phytanoyl-CoA dioxygenase family protein [Pseudomonadales bacterium]